MTTLQEPVINKELANLDLSKVAALQQKRTLAFVNHFVVATIQFLNHFTKQCEQKLMRFERKLEKVDAALVLLESRLSSIPEVNITAKSPQKAETKPEVNSANPALEQPTETNLPTLHAEETPVEAKSSSPETSHSPEYNRFVKMVQVGVPLQAVKLKVSLEGLDPEVLEKILNK